MKSWFIIGTSAELIKLYPLIKKINDSGKSWAILQTGQGWESFISQVRDFQIDEDKIYCLTSHPKKLSNSWIAFQWFFYSVLVNSIGLKRKIQKKFHSIEQSDVAIIHGDTLSTLVGAIYSKVLGLKIVHIEAGLRSHHNFDPFPEEIIRKIVSRLADVHMACDEVAQKNLHKENIFQSICITSGNSIYDSIQLSLNQNLVPMENHNFVLVNIHRTENLMSKQNWDIIKNVISKIVLSHEVFIVLMPNAREKFMQDTEALQLLSHKNVKVSDRMNFTVFFNWLRASSFVVTDGGSNQEECFYLGKPCLILRERTERQEGLSSSCVLSGFDINKINKFLEDPLLYKHPEQSLKNSPTQIMFDYLYGK